MSPASYRTAPPRVAVCPNSMGTRSRYANRYRYLVGFGVGAGVTGGVGVPLGTGVAGAPGLFWSRSLLSRSSAVLSRFCASPYAVQSLLDRAFWASLYALLAASMAARMSALDCWGGWPVVGGAAEP